MDYVWGCAQHHIFGMGPSGGLRHKIQTRQSSSYRQRPLTTVCSALGFKTRPHTPSDDNSDRIFRVAYRKNYNWGAFFKEKWRDTAVSSVWNADLGLKTTLLPCDSSDITITNANILCFDDTTQPYTSSYELLFPAGMGINGHDLVPNTDSQDAYAYPANAAAGDVGKILNSVADAENTGGKVCQCRFHKGVNPLDVECPETTTNIGGFLQTDVAGNGDWLTGYPYTSNDPKYPMINPQVREWP
eukprot:5579662-Pyramimonas_sp.AAC.1